MYQGFYNLTSGMLTQQRNLNVIGNNMVNINTAGYKTDTMVNSTFQEQILTRTGQYNKGNPHDVGSMSKINTATQTYTNYSQGAFKETGNIYDFCITGQGFFAVRTDTGVQYTRNGQFSVKDDGTLELAGIGDVLGTDGQPIRIQSEDFTVDSTGRIKGPERREPAVDENGNPIYDEEGNQAYSITYPEYGQIEVVTFQDEGQLHREDNGMFTTNQAAAVANDNGETKLYWQAIEDSNVDMVQEMTSMITSQRTLQSAAQLLKMYDTVMGRAVTLGDRKSVV